MDRLPMPAAMPAELAERLSDVADKQAFCFDPWIREDIAACVPADLVDPIQDVLLCKFSTLEAYEEARQKLEKAIALRFSEL